MPDAATISELRKAAAVTDEQIDAAVTAYLADETTGAFSIAEGVTLDLAKGEDGTTDRSDRPDVVRCDLRSVRV